MRRFVRNLALFAFALVIVQAVLGGLTVLLLLPLAIAVSHAATAQAFFCLTVALALLLNPKWRTLARVEPAGERPRLPLLAAVTTAVIYIQILVGAVMRHMGAGLAIPDFPLAFGKILPPLESIPEQINFAHRVGAIVVTVMVCWTAIAVLRSYARQPLLRRPAVAMLVLLAATNHLGRRDHSKRPRSPPDHGSCGRRGGIAGHQPGPDDAGVSIDRRQTGRTGRQRIVRRPRPGGRDETASYRVNQPAATATLEIELTRSRPRALYYLALTKPRVLTMILAATLTGFYLGSAGRLDLRLALNLVIGTAMAAGGTLALNQYLERDLDARMDRTRSRPLPAGNLYPVQALWFGGVLIIAGFAHLYFAVGGLCAAVTAAITVSYLAAYTPLKRVSSLCTVVGAVPGALPPVAGWAAVRGSIDMPACVLFAIIYLWQLPHTLAIAQLYREDFQRAGIHLLATDDPRGGATARQMIMNTLALMAVAMLPTVLHFAGLTYFVVGDRPGRPDAQQRNPVRLPARRNRRQARAGRFADLPAGATVGDGAGQNLMARDRIRNEGLGINGDGGRA